MPDGTLRLSKSAFCAWLCLHEHEVFDRPGSWFHCPLARWLSDLTGHVYGVDRGRYGRAYLDECYWLPLPPWAQAFHARLEARGSAPITAYDAFVTLASVELAFALQGRRQHVAQQG